MVCGNRYAVKGLLVIALSYLRYNTRPVTIHFLSMDHSEANPKFVPPTKGQYDYIDALLKTGHPESKLISYDVTKEFKAQKWHHKFNKSSYTPYALLRLFSDHLDLPEKVLYLDTDTFILGDLGPCYDMDMGGYEFAGALDQLGTFWIGATYQNSGVLLLNMPQIRATGLFSKCRDFLARKHPILADQDALYHNVGPKKFLPQIYNEQVHSHEDTVIRHFSKTLRWFPFFHLLNVKPWHVDRISKVDDPARFHDVLADYLSRIEELEAL
ncbi:MAG: hypothetical protein IJU64_07045 [Bacilli bacterium]|nr:hypothetical protein [Bacilli bacterium]